jgi:TetR/AcrR family transcriptional regulator, transcriptional repressor for nem operon
MKNFGDRWQLYFDAVRHHIARFLAQAQSEGTFGAGLDPENLAVSLTALIQGGYVLARTFRDEALMRRAAEGALALISEIFRPK